MKKKKKIQSIDDHKCQTFSSLSFPFGAFAFFAELFPSRKVATWFLAFLGNNSSILCYRAKKRFKKLRSSQTADRAFEFLSLDSTKFFGTKHPWIVNVKSFLHSVFRLVNYSIPAKWQTRFLAFLGNNSSILYYRAKKRLKKTEKKRIFQFFAFSFWAELAVQCLYKTFFTKSQFESL